MYLRIDVERPNFRAALADCLSHGDAEQGLRLCCALRSAWVAYGDVTEGTGWFDRFLALIGESPSGAAARPVDVPSRSGPGRWCTGPSWPSSSRTSTPRPGAPRPAWTCWTPPASRGGASGLRILGLVSLRRGRPTTPWPASTRPHEAARAAGSYGVTGRKGWRSAPAPGSWPGSASSPRPSRPTRARWTCCATTTAGASPRPCTGSARWPASAATTPPRCAHFRDALRLFREIDARTEIARCLAGIGWVALAQLDLELAATSLTESLQLSLATGQRLAIARGLDSFAALAVLEDDLARAVKLAGAASALRAAGHDLSGSAQARLESLKDTARRALGAARTDALVAEGAGLSAHEAVAYALGLRDGADEAADPPASGAAAPAPGGGPPDGPAPSPRGAANGVSRGRAAPLPGLVSASGVLTARELEIARLIARGLSNRGIAAELTISPATAARHVANIFGKLGFTSRAQVAAWAAEREPGTHR